jgi:hypothetical protein
MRIPLQSLFGRLARHHFFGSMLLVLGVGAIISTQLEDRRSFADGDLHQDVIDRWGAPIVQPAPSLRFVESGSVFSTLEALPFDGQEVTVDTAMNYRKRGLIYFSGFDFTFRGDYRMRNPRERDLDLVFVFPISVEKNRVLLSDLSFLVDGRPAPIDLSPPSDRLVWTGRIASGNEVRFQIAFRGRGLDSFVYQLDPKLPVRDLKLRIAVSGGDRCDYPSGVVPATSTEHGDGRAAFAWAYPSLESGVPVGVILPSEKAFDAMIATMERRSWAPFLFFFAALTALSLVRQRRLRIYEAYLVAFAYAFFFVLLAYLAAYLSFYLAYALSLAIIGGLSFAYLRALLGREASWPIAGLELAFLALPTMAVILDGYTGLIYALEILAGLVVLMVLSTRARFRSFFEPTNGSLSIQGAES